MASGRVLSIQSHVVHGYVGNKSASFPLQLLGFDVDPINSVQFSNHTGYKSFKGQRLNGNELWELVEGLDANDLLHYSHLLTGLCLRSLSIESTDRNSGYIGTTSFLETVLRVLNHVREKNPNLIYGAALPHTNHHLLTIC
jgi:pyridoxine kinase